MSDLIERLRWRAENTSTPSASTPKLCAEAADTIAALTARVEELEGALTPFAEALKGNWSHQPDVTMVRAGLNTSDLRMHLTLGHFRRARAAITQEPGE